MTYIVDKTKNIKNPQIRQRGPVWIVGIKASTYQEFFPLLLAITSIRQRWWRYYGCPATQLILFLSITELKSPWRAHFYWKALTTIEVTQQIFSSISCSADNEFSLSDTTINCRRFSRCKVSARWEARQTAGERREKVTKPQQVFVCTRCLYASNCDILYIRFPACTDVMRSFSQHDIIRHYCKPMHDTYRHFDGLYILLWFKLSNYIMILKPWRSSCSLYVNNGAIMQLLPFELQQCAQAIIHPFSLSCHLKEFRLDFMYFDLH